MRRMLSGSAQPDLALAPPAALSASVLETRAAVFALLEWPIATVNGSARLTAAERAVADLVLAGLSNDDIARRRGRSTRTIANQVASVYRKLGVESRLGLFAMAWSHS